VIIPKENEKDLRDVPKEVMKELRVILVDHVDQVLVNALAIKQPKDLFKVQKERIEGIKAQYTGHTSRAQPH
jgi:ATP-dependent Lon protease